MSESDVSAEIKPGDFVKISYTAKLKRNGEVIDTTDEKVAKEYGIYNEDARYGDIVIAVGEGNVVKGLDDELVGKKVGFKGTIEVPPEKAFGERDEDKVEVISIKRFREKPRVGQRVRIDNKVGTVKRIIGRRVFVDFNHPLAGETLVFDIEVKEKVEDLKEKVKALFVIYTGLDVEVETNESKVRVVIPKGASLNQIFIIGKYDAIAKIFKLLDVSEVEIVERFIKEKEMEMIKAVESSEVESESEDKVEEVEEEKSEEVREEVREEVPKES